MTKKDYELIAGNVKQRLEFIGEETFTTHEEKLNATKAVILLAHDLAIAFKKDNSRFDYDRFTEACGFHGSNTVDYR